MNFRAGQLLRQRLTKLALSPSAACCRERILWHLVAGAQQADGVA